VLKQEFGVEADLVRGADGIFDVVADGELVFSKHDEGRFPENEEVVAALRR
jgi:selenoprotein W-related protein